MSTQANLTPADMSSWMPIIGQTVAMVTGTIRMLFVKCKCKYNFAFLWRIYYFIFYFLYACPSKRSVKFILVPNGVGVICL